MSSPPIKSLGGIFCFDWWIRLDGTDDMPIILVGDGQILVHSRCRRGCFAVTGRHEPITNDGDLLGRVLAFHSYLGVTSKWLCALFKQLCFNVKCGTW
jgi:hypothetical protein